MDVIAVQSQDSLIGAAHQDEFCVQTFLFEEAFFLCHECRQVLDIERRYGDANFGLGATGRRRQQPQARQSEKTTLEYKKQSPHDVILAAADRNGMSSTPDRFVPKRFVCQRV
jgi:hypothetical protein